MVKKNHQTKTLFDLIGKNSQEYVGMILKAEYKVYMRELDDQHCFVTDGTHIGYCQWSDYRPSVLSVHLPSIKAGTGFVIANEITEETIKAAMFTHCPHWFNFKEYSNSIQKYRDWEHYHNASKWNKTLIEVTE